MSFENFKNILDAKVKTILHWIVLGAVIFLGVKIQENTSAVNVLSSNLLEKTSNIEERITHLEEEGYTDSYERGRAGIISVQNAGLTTVEEIEEFYSIKPAGRMDMKQACRNSDVVNQLNQEFDGAMTTICTIFN